MKFLSKICITVALIIGMYIPILSTEIAIFDAQFLLFKSVHAQIDYSVLKGNVPVTVSATVGSQGTFLSLSGFASPNASIVLLDEYRNALRSAVADENGNFIMAGMSVYAGTNTYCLLTVDFKRLGESETCIEIDIIDGQTTSITGLFLPPTIGVQNDKINQGDEALIYGYTMPNATVTLTVDNGQKITVSADSTGYYEYRTTSLSAGKHSFKAEGLFNTTESLPTETTAFIDSLSVPAQIKQTVEDTGKKITTAAKDIGTFPGFIFPLIAIPLLALIAALLLALNPFWREKVFAFIRRFLPLPAGIGWHWRKSKKMHHDWIIDFEHEVRTKDQKLLQKQQANEKGKNSVKSN